MDRDSGGGKMVEEARRGLSSMRSPEGTRQRNDGKPCLQEHQIMRGHTRT